MDIHDIINGLQVRIFPNKFKRKSIQPDYTGKHTIEEKDYTVSAWVNEGKTGEYLTLKFSQMKSKEVLAKEKEKDEEDGISNEDDLPF